MVKSTLCAPLQHITTRVATVITRIYGICPSRLRFTSSCNFSIKTIINGVCHVITKEKKIRTKFITALVYSLIYHVDLINRNVENIIIIYYILLRTVRERGMLCILVVTKRRLSR